MVRKDLSKVREFRNAVGGDFFLMQRFLPGDLSLPEVLGHFVVSC